jgi:hypothetical protein
MARSSLIDAGSSFASCQGWNRVYLFASKARTKRASGSTRNKCKQAEARNRHARVVMLLPVRPANKFQGLFGPNKV